MNTSSYFPSNAYQRPSLEQTEPKSAINQPKENEPGQASSSTDQPHESHTDTMAASERMAYTLTRSS